MILPMLSVEHLASQKNNYIKNTTYMIIKLKSIMDIYDVPRNQYIIDICDNIP